MKKKIYKHVSVWNKNNKKNMGIMNKNIKYKNNEHE